MLPEQKACADRTLLGSCARLTPQQFYNQKQTATNNFLAEKGKTTTKAENVKKRPNLTGCSENEHSGSASPSDTAGSHQIILFDRDGGRSPGASLGSREITPVLRWSFPWCFAWSFGCWFAWCFFWCFYCCAQPSVASSHRGRHWAHPVAALDVG